MIVLAGVVIGMPRCVVASSVRVRWIFSPARGPRFRRTVTWIAPAPSGRRSHALAAVPWLSKPPVANVAASHRPSILSTL
jgi:hypothetical protein